MRHSLHSLGTLNVPNSRISQNSVPRELRPLEVSVVIPTFNEIKNVPTLINQLSRVLSAYEWEVIFVDDNSPDRTWQEVKDIARQDRRVRGIRRIHRRGLSGACIEGILSSTAPIVIVMDGDLQHDEQILPRMIEKIDQDNFDIVVGSRYMAGGSIGNAFSQKRAAASQIATALAQRATGTKVSDVMSGFFALRRDCFDEIAVQLSTTGFKILLDILASSRKSLRVTEIDYVFHRREDGESKFDLQAVWDFVGLLINKASRGVIPARFVQFVLVGSLGVLIHLLTLSLLMAVFHTNFATSQIGATLAAMTNNFLVNNLLTYRDMKLKGLALLKGLTAFYFICSAGAIANIGIAAWLFEQHHTWWLSGLVGAVMGALWNYTVSSALVWRR